MGRTVHCVRIAVATALLLPWGAGLAEEERRPRSLERACTLEDIYGDTGNSFQAAIGFINFEGTPSSQATQSYGVAVDDVVVKWREFTLDADVTDCATSGACATVELATTNTFLSVGLLTISVLDPTPEAVSDSTCSPSFT